MRALLNPGNQLMFAYRIYHRLAQYTLLRPLSYIMYIMSRIIYSSDIHPLAKIGKGSEILHHFNIVIGGTAVIGKNCVLLNGVTLGDDGRSGRCPTIGDNVMISTGVKILGDIKIGSNSIIGANSVVMKDRPEDSLIVGCPAVPKRKINRSEYMYSKSD